MRYFVSADHADPSARLLRNVVAEVHQTTVRGRLVRSLYRANVPGIGTGKSYVLPVPAIEGVLGDAGYFNIKVRAVR